MDSPPPSLSSSLPVSLSLSLMCAHRHLCLFLYCLLLVYTPLMVPGCTFNDQNKSKRHFHIYMSSIVFVYLRGAMKHAMRSTWSFVYNLVFTFAKWRNTIVDISDRMLWCDSVVVHCQAVSGFVC